MLFLVSSQFLLAQKVEVSIVSPQNYALKETHVEVEKSYYLVDNVENLSQLDMASLIEQEFVRVVENYYVNENRTVTRIHYKEMKNAFEIGVKPTLLVMDAGNVAMFDENGQVMTSFHQNKDDMINESLDLDKLYRATQKPTNAEKAQLENEGAIVTELGEGKLKIDIDGDLLFFKGDRMYSEMSFYSEEGDLEGKEYIVFEKLPSGESIMKRRKNIHYVTLPSGACAEFVQKITYKSYDFEDRRVESRSKRMKTKELKEAFVLSPNPIEDVIFIDYAQVFDDSEQLDLAIYSIAGSLVKRLKVANSGSLSIPVDDLKAGVYLMKVKDHTGNRRIQKFVKL